MYRANPEILFFILIYLLLFYDSSALTALRGTEPEKTGKHGSPSVLLFIICFLLLFYKPAGQCISGAGKQ